MKTKLGQARKNRRMTQELVSKLADIPLSTLRRWEQGVNEPDLESLLKLSQLYDTPIGFILGCQEELASSSDSSASARPTRHPKERTSQTGITADEAHPIPVEMKRRWPDAYFITVNDEAMNRVLPKGCLALVDPAQRNAIIDGKVYAVLTNDATIRIARLHQLQNGIELIPDSHDPTCRSICYDFNNALYDKIAVVGRVVWCTMPFDYPL